MCEASKLLVFLYASDSTQRPTTAIAQKFYEAERSLIMQHGPFAVLPTRYNHKQRIPLFNQQFVKLSNRACR